MQSFEMLPAVYMFYIYFLAGVVGSLVLKFIFKKSPTYYIIFLSTVVLFATFSKEFVPNLPFDIMDVPRIISKFCGMTVGILVMNLVVKQQKTKRRKLT